MQSTVFDWEKIKVETAGYGVKRQVFDGRTAKLEHLECHATTLNPGQTTHPPRPQSDDELVVVKEGTIEANMNGQPKRAVAGDVIYVAANDVYGVRNPGEAPATYYVIKFAVGGAPKSETK
jgi:quercetin dioxygenase-like cupin family protein